MAEGGTPTPDHQDVPDERWRRARLAHIRQELLAPVGAIAGYADILHEEAARLNLTGMTPDLDRILASAAALRELVEHLPDVGSLVGRQEASEDAAVAQQRLRHDLRNPLNAVKGYGEMLLEDLDDFGGGALRPDLDRLLAEVARLLASLDGIVTISEAGEASAMVAGLLRTIRPPNPDEARARGTGSILVVDDNASNRDLLLRRLALEGHRMVEACSGGMALQILQAEAIDLILLDLVMPEMNGLQALERLKADERLREIPVIMISGLQETESAIRCIEAGAEDYLPKPFDPVLLRARIGACLERKRWRDRERQYQARLEAEKERSEALLRNILPSQIVGRLNGGETVIADRLEAVTILFCDLVGFTEIAARTPPGRLVDDLNRLFSMFDALTGALGVEKIKTIGDAYMAAAGVPEPRPDHAEVSAELAVRMLETVERLNYEAGTAFRVRIGMHTGPVVAGIIGRHKFIYDVWGDTVNVASRLEERGLPGGIHVSDEICRALKHRYRFQPRGAISLRGKGRMRTFFLKERA